MEARSAGELEVVAEQADRLVTDLAEREEPGNTPDDKTPVPERKSR